MNSAKKELLDYLNYQFPATIGHIPLKDMIHNVWKQGMMDAAEIARNHEDKGYERRGTKEAILNEVK